MHPDVYVERLGHAGRPGFAVLLSAVSCEGPSVRFCIRDRPLHSLGDQEGLQVSFSSRIRRLQRQHAIDLSAVTINHPIGDTGGSAPSVSGDKRGELVGFAAASALRSLKVPHTVEDASGVLLCDAEDLSAWAHRRHIELLTRLQQRRRRGKEEVHELASHSSDSEIDADMPMQHGRRKDMSGELDSASLTPGLSGRGPPAGGLQSGLNSHTSTLRASSLHAQHMVHSAPLPDSIAYIWDQQVPLNPPHSAVNGSRRPNPASMHADIDRLGQAHVRRGSDLNGAGVAPGHTHANHAHEAQEENVNASSSEG